jgi:hypothetical protein
MALFKCEDCNCVENTALSLYWDGSRKCSECDTRIGKWHGRFKKHLAEGMLITSDGKLYPKSNLPYSCKNSRRD